MGTDDSAHTIRWTVSHYAALNPTFTVTVRIYELSGDLVATFQEGEVGTGAYERGRWR